LTGIAAAQAAPRPAFRDVWLIAVGCQMLLPKPTSAMHASSIA